MLTFKSVFLFGISLFVLAFFTGSGQQVFKTTSTSVIAYLEYLPPDYVNNSDKYPVVFFLHGNGERGADGTDPAVLKTTIDLVTKHGPSKFVKAGTDFPFILISPQLKKGVSNWNTAYIMEVINHCKTYLRIDEKRIYLTGLSLGGGGTWTAAQDYPALFAAIAPVCGGYNAPTKACGIAAENLPVWAFHGDKDTVVPLSKTQTMVNAINACTPTPSPLAALTIYRGVAHNAWDYAYRTDNSLHNPNFYQWIVTQKNTHNKNNAIPTVVARNDFEFSGATTTISATATDPDGSISSYAWTKLSGPSVTLSNTTSGALSLSNASVGDYLFRVKVTDNSGNTDSDYVRVVKLANSPPVANAGADQQITLPVSSMTINGTATDSDNNISNYSWTKISGGSATMSGTTSGTLSLTNLTEGSYTFRLSVVDAAGATDIDDIILTVKPPITPIVNAGVDKLVKLPTTALTIVGSATDAGGSIISYRWTKISGNTCTLNNATSSSLKLAGLSSGTYTFRLTATDNHGYTGYDDVIVRVDAPPVVSAGADQTVVLPMLAAVILKGTATDADGSIVQYLWSKYSGPNLLAEGSNTAEYKLNRLYEGVYVFKLAVKDNLGVQSIDYVTVTVTTQPQQVVIGPTVNAGSDKIVRLPSTSTQLSGSASDTDGSIESYLWTRISGNTCTMTNTSSAYVKLSGLKSGVYVFRLTAKDNEGNTGYDDVKVTVNAPPVVNAGADLTVQLPMTSPVVLHSTATDTDGTIVKYLWSKYSGPNISAEGSNLADYTLKTLYEGTYVFKLAVTDDMGMQGYDYVTVIVKSPTTTAASSKSAQIVHLSNDNDILFENVSADDLANAVVHIYNENLQQIYAGPWTSEDHFVLERQGFYLFKIISNGKILASGKVIKR